MYGEAVVFGDARVFGDAVVCGHARVSVGNISQSSHVVYVSGYVFHITATPDGVQIGCEWRDWPTWLSMRKAEAVALGLPAEEFAATKVLIRTLYKRLTKK